VGGGVWGGGEDRGGVEKKRQGCEPFGKFGHGKKTSGRGRTKNGGRQ